MCEPNDFYVICEFLRFDLTQKALFQVILGLLLECMQIERKGAYA